MSTPLVHRAVKRQSYRSRTFGHRRNLCRIEFFTPALLSIIIVKKITCDTKKPCRERRQSFIPPYPFISSQKSILRKVIGQIGISTRKMEQKTPEAHLILIDQARRSSQRTQRVIQAVSSLLLFIVRIVLVRFL